MQLIQQRWPLRNYDTPNVGFCLNDYAKLENAEVSNLLALYSGCQPVQQHNSCLLCGKENIKSDHDVNCPHAAGYRIGRHNYIVAKVTEEINDYRVPRPVLKELGNLNDNGGRPDIEFEINK